MHFYCRKCDTLLLVARNFVEESDACTACGSKGLWRTVNDPKSPWMLSKDDVEFLRVNRIKP